MDKALNSYRLAGSWREAFALANQLQHSEDDIQGLAYDLMGKPKVISWSQRCLTIITPCCPLIEYLKDKSRFDEAAIVAVDYAKVCLYNDVERDPPYSSHVLGCRRSGWLLAQGLSLARSYPSGMYFGYIVPHSNHADLYIYTP